MDVGDGSPGEEELADEFGETQSRYLDVIEAGSDAQKQIGDHGGDDLEPDGVLVGAEEFADVEMLLDPAKQKLDLPSGFVEAGDLDSGAFEVIGDEGHGLAGVRLEANAAQRDIEFGIAFAGELDLGIVDDAEAVAEELVDRSGSSGSEPHAGLRAGDEESLGAMDVYPPIETAVALVEDVGCGSFDRGLAPDLDIVDGGWGNLERARDIGFGIVDDVHLHAPDAPVPLGPIAELSERDGAGIDEADHLGPFATDLPIGHAGQHRKDPGKDFRRPASIGIRQGRASQLANTDMVMMIAVGVEAQNQCPQTTGMIELGTDESHQMIPTGERLIVGVPFAALDDGGKLPAINGFKKARENASSEAHARLSFCVSTTRKYQEIPDLAGMHPRHIESSPDSPARSGEREGPIAEQWEGEGPVCSHVSMIGR